MIKKCLAPANTKRLRKRTTLGYLLWEKILNQLIVGSVWSPLKSTAIQSATRVARGRRLLWIGKTNRDRAKLGLSKKNSLVLSTKEAILKAEIFQALHMVEKNYIFASAKGDSDRFQLMFLDSTIAKGYQQSDSKVQYVIKVWNSWSSQETTDLWCEHTIFMSLCWDHQFPSKKTIWWVCDLLLQKVW